MSDRSLITRAVEENKPELIISHTGLSVDELLELSINGDNSCLGHLLDRRYDIYCRGLICGGGYCPFRVQENKESDWKPFKDFFNIKGSKSPNGQELIEEAKKRGFKKGVIAIHLTDGSKKEIKSNNYTYYRSSDSLYTESSSIGKGTSVRIYHKGEWSEVIDRWWLAVEIGMELQCKSQLGGRGGSGYHPNLIFKVYEIRNDKEIFMGGKGDNGVYIESLINPFKRENFYKVKTRTHLDNLKEQFSSNNLLKKEEDGKRSSSIEICSKSSEVSRGQRPTGKEVSTGRSARVIRIIH
jgi:hypothetical protein